MNKSQLIEIVKRNEFLLKTYSIVLNGVINVLKLFVKTDDCLILFVSYGGRYFNDSPKCIYEAMRKDPRFEGYRLVWAFRDPQLFSVQEKVRIDTIKYFYIALSARCWVTNVNIERGLNFSGKNTYYFHTTHGVLPKLTGNDAKPGSTFGWDFKYNYDCSCAQSNEEMKYQISAYGLKPHQVLVCGYPKNDELINCSSDNINDIRCKIGIPKGKKIILYAPTFRENNPTGINKLPDFEKWRRSLGDKFIILFRAHPIVSERLNSDVMNGFLYDVSNYPDNTDIMKISDVLISDYSGIFFEFCILDRPMYCFAYDYDEYEKQRGLYFDIRDELPGGHLKEEELLELISSEVDVMSQVRLFAKKYVSKYGNATHTSVDTIFEAIKK